MVGAGDDDAADDDLQLGPEGMEQYEQGGGGGGGDGPFGGGGGGFKTEFRSGQKMNMEDLFQEFFGGQAYQPRRGPDLQVLMAILVVEYT